MTGHNDSDSSDVTGAATDTPAMLMVDQKSRWLRGDRVLVEEYCQRIPSLRNHAESLLDLIYSEVLLRERYGEQPKLAEYVEQFPHLADQLRVQFELDQAMYSWNTSNERTRSATNPDNVLEHIGERGMGPVEVVREQLPIGLVTVAGRQPTTTTTDLQSLLHKRLRFIALLFLVGITIMVVGGVTPGHDLRR